MLHLGMIVRNEAEMLQKTLPVTRDARIGFRLAIDTGSTDSTDEILRREKFSIGFGQWHGNYAEARNDLLFFARLTIGKTSDDWLLMLDADECMWPDEIDMLAARCKLSNADLVTLPRINLAGPHAELQEVGSYPDKQPRCIRLSAHIEFRNRVHEVACYAGHEGNIPGEGKDGFANDLHIYHYGWCKTPAENWLRSNRYRQIGEGESETFEIPEAIRAISHDEWIKDMKTRHRFMPFTKGHPLQGLI